MVWDLGLGGMLKIIWFQALSRGRESFHKPHRMSLGTFSMTDPPAAPGVWACCAQESGGDGVPRQEQTPPSLLHPSVMRAKLVLHPLPPDWVKPQ